MEEKIGAYRSKYFPIIIFVGPDGSKGVRQIVKIKLRPWHSLTFY
jgi:hypothetical protein